VSCILHHNWGVVLLSIQQLPSEMLGVQMSEWVLPLFPGDILEL